MIRVTFGQITIAGDTRENFAWALAQLGEVVALAKEHGATSIPARLPGNAIASVPGAVPHGGKGQNVADYLAQTGGERFRRSKAELAAGLTEEGAAGFALKHGYRYGTASVGGGEAGAVGGEAEGVSADAGEVDAELLREFMEGGAEEGEE